MSGPKWRPDVPGGSVKICSLLPSGTEILYALGLGDRIVGVSDLCDHPPDVRGKPVVSRSLVDTSVLGSAQVEEVMRAFREQGRTPFELDEAWFRSVRPDLILTQDLCSTCEVDADSVVRLVERLLPSSTILVLAPRTVGDILQTILRVGTAAGVSRRAEDVVQCLRDRIESVRRRTSTLDHRPRVLSLEGLDPLVAGGHWIPELRTIAGGRDERFRPGCPAERLSWEEILELAPEVLVLAPCSSNPSRSLEEIPALSERVGWRELPAVRFGEVYIVDHVYFSRPGPRVVDGLEILARILHPGTFRIPLPAGAVLQLALPQETDMGANPLRSGAESLASSDPWPFRPYR